MNDINLKEQKAINLLREKFALEKSLERVKFAIEYSKKEYDLHQIKKDIEAELKEYEDELESRKKL